MIARLICWVRDHRMIEKGSDRYCLRCGRRERFIDRGLSGVWVLVVPRK